MFYYVEHFFYNFDKKKFKLYLWKNAVNWKEKEKMVAKRTIRPNAYIFNEQLNY